jgi:hypothetical protein
MQYAPNFQHLFVARIFSGRGNIGEQLPFGIAITYEQPHTIRLAIDQRQRCHLTP